MTPGGGCAAPSAGAPDAWAGDRFAHEALLFDDDRRLLDRCIPFVHEARAAGQPVLAVTTDRTAAALRDGLGADAAELQVLGPAERRWAGGHATLLSYDRDFRRVAAAGVAWRLIAEPVWLERPDGQEWHRFESACNRLFSAVPYYSLCLHDRRRLGDGVLGIVRQTHPLVCDERGSHRSVDFVEPESLVPRLEPSWSEVPVDAVQVAVASAAQGRRAAGDAASRAGLEGRRDEIVLAVDELVERSLECCGAATVASWRSETHLHVQVDDVGGGALGALAGYCPPSGTTAADRAVWLARALSDDATLRSGPHGKLGAAALRGARRRLSLPRWPGEEGNTVGGSANLVDQLHAATGVDIPESDYAQVDTLDGLIGYLAARAVRG